MHSKRSESIAVGGEVSSGTRKLRLDSTGEVFEVTLTIKKGETVEVKNPSQRDSNWIYDDPGEGDMVEVKHYVKVGDKIRVGGFRQFRIMPAEGGLRVIIVEPS